MYFWGEKWKSQWIFHPRGFFNSVDFSFLWAFHGDKCLLGKGIFIIHTRLSALNESYYFFYYFFKHKSLYNFENKKHKTCYPRLLRKVDNCDSFVKLIHFIIIRNDNLLKNIARNAINRKWTNVISAFPLMFPDH